jgi:hypothetical protein
VVRPVVRVRPAPGTGCVWQHARNDIARPPPQANLGK